jgi:peroxiredoxin
LTGTCTTVSYGSVFQNVAPACRGAYLAHALALLALSLSLSTGLGAAVFAGQPTTESSAASEPPAELASIDGDKPAFTLDDLDRQHVALASQRSDVLVVHFFATWCEPCRDELPALTRLVARSDPARLRVLTISVAEVDARVRNFIEKMPVNFPILLDRDRGVAKSWNVSALPTTFILDRDLKPRLFVERDYDWDRVDASQLVKAFEDPSRLQNRNTKTENPAAYQSEGERR